MPAPDKSLSQHEIDLLLQSLQKKTGEIFEVEQKPAVEAVGEYDFKKPERVARDQLRQLETMHEIFTRNFQAYLSTSLRTIVDVRIEAVEQLIYSEFINSVSNPTVFNVISLEPLEGHMIMELSPSTAFVIIEKLLGGGRTDKTYPDRALTDIEWRLISSVLNKVLSLLEEVWSNVTEVKFKILAQESNPRLVQIIAPNEPVIFIMVRITIGESEGYLKLCVPIISIETILPKLSASLFQFARRRGVVSHETEIIRGSLNSATITLICNLLETTITLKELLEIEEGDIITTNIPANSPVVITAEQKKKFYGTPGLYRNQKAVKISQVISEAS